MLYRVSKKLNNSLYTLHSYLISKQVNFICVKIPLKGEILPMEIFSAFWRKKSGLLLDCVI